MKPPENLWNDAGLISGCQCANTSFRSPTTEWNITDFPALGCILSVAPGGVLLTSRVPTEVPRLLQNKTGVEGSILDSALHFIKQQNLSQMLTGDRTPVSVSVKCYFCANGDEPFDRQNGSASHSVRQRKFNRDSDGDSRCKRNLKRFQCMK